MIDLDELDKLLSGLWSTTDESYSTDRSPTYVVMNPKTYRRLKKETARYRGLWRGYKPRGRKNIVHRYGGR